MITTEITLNGQTSEPFYVSRGQTLGVSITGTWTGTVEVQRAAAETAYNPDVTDADYGTYESKTANAELSLSLLAPGWYRFKATAAMTGTATCKMWV